jgi:hypothetical protein
VEVFRYGNFFTLRLSIITQSIPAKPSNKYKVKQKEEKEGKDA